MNISDTTVSVVIDLAKQKRDAYEKYMEKFFPDRGITFGDDKHKDSLEYNQFAQWDHELKGFLMDLDYTTIITLEALMSFGRGDWDSLEDAEDYFKSQYPSAEGKMQAVDYITEKIPLHEYLNSAYEKLKM